MQPEQLSAFADPNFSFKNALNAQWYAVIKIGLTTFSDVLKKLFSGHSSHAKDICDR
jgi:hypothetical protein